MASQSVAVKPMRPKRILIVDDDAVIRMAIAEALIDEGYQVAEAADGQAALTRLATWSAELIVLDLAMPAMDGWTFLSEWRRTTAAVVPIVVISTLLEKQAHLLGLGATIVLTKPFDLDRLLTTIDRLVSPPSPGE